MFKTNHIVKIAVMTIAALLVSIQARTFADTTTTKDSSRAAETLPGNGAKKKARGETAGTSDSATTSQGTVSTSSRASSSTTDGAKRKASGETAGVGDDTTTASSSTVRVDLNTASRAELESLPGVGPATAQAIVAARPFKSVADLKRVDGIGDAKFGQLKSKVVVSHDRSSAVGSPATTSSGSSQATPRSNRDNTPRSESTTRTENGRNYGKANSTSGTVNINTASKEELEALPGVGPVKAQAIIDARPFKNPEDIQNVRGIKEGTYTKIRDQITVR